MNQSPFALTESFNSQHKILYNAASPSIDAKIGTLRLAKPDETKGGITISDCFDDLLLLVDEVMINPNSLVLL